MAEWPSSSNQTPSYILSSATGPKLFHHFTFSPVTHIFSCLALSPWVIFHSLSQALLRSRGIFVQSGPLWCFSNTGITEKVLQCREQWILVRELNKTQNIAYCLICTTTTICSNDHLISATWMFCKLCKKKKTRQTFHESYNDLKESLPCSLTMERHSSISSLVSMSHWDWLGDFSDLTVFMSL